MIIKATQKNTRQSPRKVRLVANAVRKLALADALRQLALVERRSGTVVLKTVRQAIANAMNNHGAALSDLELKNILVTGGSSYKRFRPVSRGRAHAILKRTSHITVEIKINEKKAAPAPVAQPEVATPVEAPKKAAVKTKKSTSSKEKSE